jgi:uncharacterized protein with GYD domain
MPTYIALGNWTEKGLETIKDGPSRLDSSKRILEKCGGKLHAFYVLLGGPPDVIISFEAPDNRTAARIALEMAAHGTIRGSVHPTLGEDDYKEVVAKLH